MCVCVCVSVYKRHAIKALNWILLPNDHLKIVETYLINVSKIHIYIYIYILTKLFRESGTNLLQFRQSGSSEYLVSTLMSRLGETVVG